MPFQFIHTSSPFFQQPGSTPISHMFVAADHLLRLPLPWLSGYFCGWVDVPALLQKVGISSNEAGEKVGTFALAYAAHKAASPIRFPPTVALTPIVASWIGKKVEKEN